MERQIPDFAGTWKMKSSENFEELLKALGVNVMLRKIAVAAASKPSVEITQEGETLSIRTFTSVRTTHVTFTVGESFNEATVDGRPCTVHAYTHTHTHTHTYASIYTHTYIVPFTPLDFFHILLCYSLNLKWITFSFCVTGLHPIFHSVKVEVFLTNLYK
uniref:Cytosolic fatty-acid binding proteins domain-containing protein n=1 Tax=Oncorhynchus tshawytscha TaxID=74940 RepID=A0AAZ3QXG4_ONCTS